MKRPCCIIIFTFLLLPLAQAQYSKCPRLPVNYSWNTVEEYEHDRALVKKTLRWLCDTPLGIEVQQRSVANAFVMQWLAGVPGLTVQVKSGVIPALDQYPELLYSLVHASALYVMEHPNETSELKIHTKAVEVVASLISQSKELSAEKEFRKMLRAYRRNKLKEFTALMLEADK